MNHRKWTLGLLDPKSGRIPRSLDPELSRRSGGVIQGLLYTEAAGLISHDAHRSRQLNHRVADELDIEDVNANRFLQVDQSGAGN